MKKSNFLLFPLLLSICMAQQKPVSAGLEAFGAMSEGKYNDYQMSNYIIVAGGGMLYGANLFATYKSHTVSAGLCSNVDSYYDKYGKFGYQAQYRYCLKRFWGQRVGFSLGAGYQARLAPAFASYRSFSPTTIYLRQAQVHAHVAFRLTERLEFTGEGTIGSGKFTDIEYNEDYPQWGYTRRQFTCALKYALVQR